MTDRPETLATPFGTRSPRSADDPAPRAAGVAWAEGTPDPLQIMAGGVAHDLNNALAAILGNAQLALLDAEPEGPVAACLHEIVAVSKRAGDHIRQLLAYSGQGRTWTEPLSVTRVADDTRKSLEQALPMPRIRVVQRDPLGPDAHVRADRAQLQQLIGELVLNAAAAIRTQRGFIGVETDTIETPPPCVPADIAAAAPGAWVCLRVIDDGMGMPPDVLARALEPYFSTREGGRGLGLAAAVGIARGHGGCLGLASEEGVGTVASVFLPALAPDGLREPEQLPLLSHALPKAGRLLWVGRRREAAARAAGASFVAPTRALEAIFRSGSELAGVVIESTGVGARLARLVRGWRRSLPIVHVQDLSRAPLGGLAALSEVEAIAWARARVVSVGGGSSVS